MGGDGSHLGAGSYLAEVLGVVAGRAPAVDRVAERRSAELVRELIRSGLALSAHDVGDGGLAVAVAELAFGLPEGLGVEIELASSSDPPHGALFGEDGARYVLLVPARVLDAARRVLAA